MKTKRLIVLVEIEKMQTTQLARIDIEEKENGDLVCDFLSNLCDNSKTTKDLERAINTEIKKGYSQKLVNIALTSMGSHVMEYQKGNITKNQLIQEIIQFLKLCRKTLTTKENRKQLLNDWQPSFNYITKEWGKKLGLLLRPIYNLSPKELRSRMSQKKELLRGGKLNYITEKQLQVVDRFNYDSWYIFEHIQRLYMMAITRGILKSGGSLLLSDIEFAEILNYPFNNKREKNISRNKIKNGLKRLVIIEYETGISKILTSYSPLIDFTIQEVPDLKTGKSKKIGYLITLKIGTHDNKIGCTDKNVLGPHMRLQNFLPSIPDKNTRETIACTARSLTFKLATQHKGTKKGVIEDAEIYNLGGWKIKKRRNGYLKILQNAFTNLILTIQCDYYGNSKMYKIHYQEKYKMPLKIKTGQMLSEKTDSSRPAFGGLEE